MSLVQLRLLFVRESSFLYDGAKDEALSRSGTSKEYSSSIWFDARCDALATQESILVMLDKPQ